DRGLPITQKVTQALKYGDVSANELDSDQGKGDFVAHQLSGHSFRIEFKVAAHIKGESLWESTCAGRCFLKHALIALYAADRVRRPQLGLPRSLHLDIQIHELLEPNVQLVWIALVRDAIPKKQFVLFYPEDADCRIESAPDNSKEFIIAMR